MLYHNHCMLRRQYRFPISGRSFAYLKSEREVMKTCVLRSMSFILLSWVRQKVSALVKKKNLASTVTKQTKFFSQSKAKSTSILISLRAISRAKHRLHVFSRLTRLPCFPAHNTDCMFSRVWHWLNVFPRMAVVACFPALDTEYMFSRA